MVRGAGKTFSTLTGLAAEQRKTRAGARVVLSQDLSNQLKDFLPQIIVVTERLVVRNELEPKPNRFEGTHLRLSLPKGILPIPVLAVLNRCNAFELAKLASNTPRVHSRSRKHE